MGLLSHTLQRESMMSTDTIAASLLGIKRQRGMATLIISLVLLLAMSILTLSTSRTVIMEQRMTGNDIRAKEVGEAAEAGLEYGIAWAGKNAIPWPGGGNTLTCPGGTGCPALQAITGTSTQESYNIASLIYTRPSAASDYIRVTVTVAGNADNTITATQEAYVKPGGLLTSDGKLPPPIVTDGCLTDIVGTPNAHVKWTDLDADGVQDANEWDDANWNGVIDAGEWVDTNANGVVDNEFGSAALTSHAKMNGTDPCLDPGHLDTGGGILGPVTMPDNNGDPTDNLWEYYFSVTPLQFQAAASTTLSTTPGAYWVTSTGNWPGGVYGTPPNPPGDLTGSPVVIVFEYGCPKPTGNTTVYGILFFLENGGCNGAVDSMNGWGNVTVYGSVAAVGGIDKMNANLEIYGVGSDPAAMNTITFAPIDVSRIPGTWRDF